MHMRARVTCPVPPRVPALPPAPVAEARAAIRNGAAAAAPWVRLGLSEAQQAAGMAYDKAGRIVDGSGAVLAEAGSDAARLAQEGKAAAVQGAGACGAARMRDNRVWGSMGAGQWLPRAGCASSERQKV